VALRRIWAPNEGRPAQSPRILDATSVVRLGVTVTASIAQALFLGWSIGLLPLGLPWAVVNGMAIGWLTHLIAPAAPRRRSNPDREAPHL
jgi:hypothetical protein